MSSASSLAFRMLLAFPRIPCSSVAPNDCRRNCSVAIAVANSRSAASPAPPTVPARGSVSVTSVTRRSILRSEPICVSWLPTVRAAPRGYFPYTMIAESARTASKSLRTPSAPIVSAAIAFWPMPFACCCTGSPTIWSTCFVFFNYHRRGVRHRLKLCAPDYSKSVLASVKLRAVFVYTWPPAGRGNPCSVRPLWLSIPVRLLPSLSNSCVSCTFMAEHFPKLIFPNQWRAYPPSVSSHCPHEEPNAENSADGGWQFCPHELSRLALYRTRKWARCAPERGGIARVRYSPRTFRDWQEPSPLEAHHCVPPPHAGPLRYYSR